MKSLFCRFARMAGKEPQPETYSMRHITWKRFKKDKLAMFSLALLIILVAVVFIVPLFFQISYSDLDMPNALRAPDAEHWLGTDEFGRDVFVRLIYGGRVSISVALSAIGLQVVIGITMGSLAGYFGGIVDKIIMRLTDVFMCFPFYIIAVTLAAILGPGLRNTVIIIGFLQWTGLCRIVRAQILSIKENDYIMAARSLGIRSGRIIVRHILPNIFAPILVSATLSIAGAIMAEASLSYLGLGVDVPRPSWGNMLSAAQNMKALRSQLWLWVPPGLMIVIVVLAVNYIGEGLRKAMDAKESM